MRFGPGHFTRRGGKVQTLQLPPTFALVLPLLRKIRLSRIIDSVCPIRKDAFMTHGQVVEALILHILQHHEREPLYLLNQWARERNLHLLYDIEPESFEDGRIARTLDAIEPHVQELHTKLVNGIIKQFQLPVQAVLWDLTHVSFEGAYEGSALVEPGYGHGQINEKQIKLSLHSDAASALPLMYQVLPGATNQTPLAEGYLGQLQKRLKRTSLIVVSDKAGISYDNIRAYIAKQGHFLGPLQDTPDERELIRSYDQADFEELSYRPTGKPHERFMYCTTTVTFRRQKHREPLNVPGLVIYSTQKEAADRKRRRKDIEKSLEALETVRSEYLNKSRYAQVSFAAEQLPKKIKGQAQGIVKYDLTGPDKQMQLKYWVDQEALAEAERTDGRYLLVHNTQGTPDEIFSLYKRQYLAESNFRSFNSGLSVAPVWLHKDERIRALVFIWVLALTIFILFGILAERAGLDNEPYCHRLTPRAMLKAFDYAAITKICDPGHPPEYHLDLSERITEILTALNLHYAHRLLTMP